MNRAVFLDRDGVINAALWNSTEGKWDSPYRLGDFHLQPGAAQAIRLINGLGFLAIVVSNQPGLAKGKCSPDFLDALNKIMLWELGQEGARLDSIYYCLHHPQATMQSLKADCDCRKPKPGLLLKAARELEVSLQESFMVGDSPVDIQAGLAAGCRTVLVGDHHRPRQTHQDVSPHYIVGDILAAVHMIKREGGSAWRSF